LGRVLVKRLEVWSLLRGAADIQIGPPSLFLPTRFIALAMLLALGVSSVLAQGEKGDYLTGWRWEGWHRLPDPSHIQYKVLQDKVVALSNLSQWCGLGTPSVTFSISGKIAKVNLDALGSVANFVLETGDGKQSPINVPRISIKDPGMNTADLRWIVQGLQTLLRPDWYIQGEARACQFGAQFSNLRDVGLAGRFLYLNKIASASSTKPSIYTTLFPSNDFDGRFAPQSQPASNSPGAPMAQTATNNAESIPLSVQGGTFVVPVLINGQITLNFTIDSGAADVSIPADVVSTLMRTGTLQKSDFVGQKIYRLADGSTVPSATFFNSLIESWKPSTSQAVLLPRKRTCCLGKVF